MKKIPDLGFWKLWNISFGFFGVQIAYALQSANISRIFSTLGADPHSLSYFWILPPLAGIIVQPIIGALSDALGRVSDGVSPICLQELWLLFASCACSLMQVVSE